VGGKVDPTHILQTVEEAGQNSLFLVLKFISYIIILVIFISTNVLDERLAHLKTSIEKRCDDFTPVILLMDNINLYRGRKRHDRLFTDLGPKMWNFTGRAAIVPDLSEIGDLFSCKENTTRSQIEITSLTANDLLLGKI
jgi:hypothetical protein